MNTISELKKATRSMAGTCVDSFSVTATLFAGATGFINGSVKAIPEVITSILSSPLDALEGQRVAGGMDPEEAAAKTQSLKDMSLAAMITASAVAAGAGTQYIISSLDEDDDDSDDSIESLKAKIAELEAAAAS